jgi:hypothetical protein
MADPAPVQNPLSAVLTLKAGAKLDSVQHPFTAPGSTSDPHILHFLWVISLAALGAPTKIMVTTVYDGDFDAYLDAFIDADPEKFNALLPLLQGAPPPPITNPANRAAFHTYIRDNNIPPLPGTFFSAYPTMTVIKILRCQQKP